MNESAGLEKNLQVGTGSNSYKAVGEAEVLNMLKPLFKKYKLIVFPIDGDIAEQNTTYESTYKDETTTKTRNVTQIKVKFKIVDIESGESEILMGFGNGADSQDKGSGKAFTYAYKTMLSKTFMLFSGEDADNEHSDDIGKKQDNSTAVKNLPKYQKAPNKGNKATLDDIKALENLAKEKYAEMPIYWDELKQLAADGKISTSFCMSKEKHIQWNKDDVEVIRERLNSLPF